VKAHKCALCGSSPVSFVVEGDGTVVAEGPHKGKTVKKYDLVCFACMTTELVKDANGAYVLIHDV
jgi:hypothetical protein